MMKELLERVKTIYLRVVYFVLTCVVLKTDLLYFWNILQKSKLGEKNDGCNQSLSIIFFNFKKFSNL